MKIIIEGSPKEIAALELELKNGRVNSSKEDFDKAAANCFEAFNMCHISPLVNIQNP